jgi:hypothetical protein
LGWKGAAVSPGGGCTLSWNDGVGRSWVAGASGPLAWYAPAPLVGGRYAFDFDCTGSAALISGLGSGSSFFGSGSTGTSLFGSGGGSFWSGMSGCLRAGADRSLTSLTIFSLNAL